MNAEHEIVQVMPCEPGWFAIVTYVDSESGQKALLAHRLIGWALVVDCVGVPKYKPPYKYVEGLYCEECDALMPAIAGHELGANETFLGYFHCLGGDCDDAIRGFTARFPECDPNAKDPQ